MIKISSTLVGIVGSAISGAILGPGTGASKGKCYNINYEIMGIT